MGRNFGDVPLGGGAGSASSTMLPGPRPTIVPNGILINPAVWPRQTRAKNSVVVPSFGEGELGTNLAQWAWAEAYLHTKWHLDQCRRLATIDMGRKLGAPFLGR